MYKKGTVVNSVNTCHFHCFHMVFWLDMHLPVGVKGQRIKKQYVFFATSRETTYIHPFLPTAIFNIALYGGI